MRNKILSTLVIGLLTIISYGQSKGTSNSGIKAGYNLSSIRNSDQSETNHKSGFHAGFYNEYFVANNFAFQTELLYSQQGYEVENSSYKLTQELDYINLATVFKIYPVKFFYVELGPQLGYAISHKERVESFINSTRTFTPNSFTWGLNAGVGLVSKGGFTVSGRYYYGLGEIVNDTEYFNNILQLSVAFKF